MRKFKAFMKVMEEPLKDLLYVSVGVVLILGFAALIIKPVMEVLNSSHILYDAVLYILLGMLAYIVIIYPSVMWLKKKHREYIQLLNDGIEEK